MKAVEFSSKMRPLLSYPVILRHQFFLQKVFTQLKALLKFLVSSFKCNGNNHTVAFCHQKVRIHLFFVHPLKKNNRNKLTSIVLLSGCSKISGFALFSARFKWQRATVRATEHHFTNLSTLSFIRLYSFATQLQIDYSMPRNVYSIIKSKLSISRFFNTL